MLTDQNQLPSLRNMFRITFEKWFHDGIPRHASVLTFCALFAVAPLLLFAFEVMGLVYGPEIAERLVLAQIAEFTESPAVVALMTTLLENTLPSSASWWVTASFIIVLIYGVSSFFVELKLVLNHIWGIPLDPDDGIWEFIVSRSQAIFMGIIGGLLIFSGLMVTIWLTMVTGWVALALNLGSGYETWSYIILLFVLLTIIFGLTYKFVPNANIAWQDVLVGSAATALLFSISRLLISWYFSYSYLNTMFGATSAIVIMLLWVYYSAQIFLLGAEFTYIHSHTYGAWWRGDPISQLYTAESTEPASEYTYPEDLSVLLQKEMTGQNLSARLSISDNIEENNGYSESVDISTAVTTDNIEQPTPQRRGWLSNMYRKIRIPRFNRQSVAHTREGDVEDDFILNEEQDNSVANRTKIARLRDRIHAFGSGVKQVILLPLRILRPVREVVVAVSVIGAISVAALVGIPWWRKRESENEGMAG